MRPSTSASKRGRRDRATREGRYLIGEVRQRDEIEQNVHDDSRQE